MSVLSRAFRFVLGVLPLGLCDVARADDPDAIVAFRCDQANAELQIDERFEEAPYDAPYPRVIRDGDTEFSVRGLAWIKEVNDLAVSEVREIQRECSLGAEKYVAIFSAYRWNWNPQGECGGGTPTVSITLTRNSEVILKDLVLHERCLSDREIESLRILSRTREIVAMISRRGKDELKFVRVSATSPVSRNSLFLAAASAPAAGAAGDEPNIWKGSGENRLSVNLSVLRVIPTETQEGWLNFSEEKHAHAVLRTIRRTSPRVYRNGPTYVVFESEKRDSYAPARFFWREDTLYICPIYVIAEEVFGSRYQQISIDYDTCAAMKAPT